MQQPQIDVKVNNENRDLAIDIGIRLGKLKPKNSLKALLFADFLRTAAPAPPKRYNFWKKRAPFPERDFGNTEHGCCTIASQALLALRMERLEQNRTIDFDTDEILRVYYNMTKRLYSTEWEYEYYKGDTGAYEMDALSNWRNPDLTFRDSKGRPYTIEAYTRVNHLDIEAVKLAFFVTEGKGLKLTFNLPAVLPQMFPKKIWDVPEGQALTGRWAPGSLGGHSMTGVSNYDELGFECPQTWQMPSHWVTWRFFAAYAEEVHVVFDSLNAWKKTKAAKFINLPAVASAVNAVSDLKIKGV